jgi:glucokinase
MSTLTIGVDVGGTKIAAGVVDGDERIVASTHTVTPAQDAALIRDTIVDTVRELLTDHEVEGSGSLPRASWTQPAPR